MKFGKFVFQKMNTCQHSILGIMRINRYKLRVQFQTQADANSLVTDPILALNNYIAYVPFFLTTKTGIIRNYPTDLLNPEFCRSQFKIIKAERMKRFIKVNDDEHGTPPSSVSDQLGKNNFSKPMPPYLSRDTLSHHGSYSFHPKAHNQPKLL